MGIFKFQDKNNDVIIPNNLKDQAGLKVNERGYLVNETGDIVNREGETLFLNQELKSGEFPKIFKFSKLDYSIIQGRFKRDH